MDPKPITHQLLNKNGTVTKFTAVPFMTVDEAREIGAQKIADPNFIQSKVDSALQKAGLKNADGESSR